MTKDHLCFEMGMWLEEDLVLWKRWDWNQCYEAFWVLTVAGLPVDYRHQVTATESRHPDLRWLQWE